MLLADSMLQGSADLITFAIIGLLAWLGSRYGLFLATVWGLQALVTVVAAFAVMQRVDDLLMWGGMTNEFGTIWRQTIAFVTSLAIVAIATRVAIGTAIPEGATNYPPLVDLVGGGLVGALAGSVVAGILQVVLAMAPLPAWASFDHSKVGWDLGQGIIELVAKSAPLSKDDLAIMMDGEPGFPVEKAEAEKPPVAPVDPSQPPVEKIELPQWSEVFADVNWNQQWDEGEKYIDADKNGAFSWLLRSNDVNTSKTRDIGLRERYTLGPWVTVKTLEKQDVQRLQRNGRLGPVFGLPFPPPGGLAPGAAAQPAVAAPGGSPLPAPGSTPGFVPAAPVQAGVPPTVSPVSPPGAPVPVQPGVPTLPAQPTNPPAQPAPGAGTPPGVPKQPGQPSGTAQPTPVVPQPGTAPTGQPASGSPPQSAPPIEIPGRANETPKPPPGNPSPFKPAPKK